MSTTKTQGGDNRLSVSDSLRETFSLGAVRDDSGDSGVHKLSVARVRAVERASGAVSVNTVVRSTALESLHKFLVGHKRNLLKSIYSGRGRENPGETQEWHTIGCGSSPGGGRSRGGPCGRVEGAPPHTPG